MKKRILIVIAVVLVMIAIPLIMITFITYPRDFNLIQEWLANLSILCIGSLVISIIIGMTIEIVRAIISFIHWIKFGNT